MNQNDFCKHLKRSFVNGRLKSMLCTKKNVLILDLKACEECKKEQSEQKNKLIGLNTNMDMSMIIIPLLKNILNKLDIIDKKVNEGCKCNKER